MAFSTNIGRIVIFGVGLIGGSIGLALKKRGYQGKIIGLGRRWSSLKQALDAKAIDSAEMDFSSALSDADILIVCTPVDLIPKIVEKAIEYIPKGCIITDVGSTKAKIVEEIEKIIPNDVYFVGGHPMAGSHKTGVESADPDLFDGTMCILTPSENTNHDAINTISEMWYMVGAFVEQMTPSEHDFLIASASHLPHVVASALVQVVANSKIERGSAIDFASKGFADATRIAAGSPEIWKGILLQNAEMVASILHKMESELAEFINILETKDEVILIEKLTKAKQIRDSFKK